MDYETNEESERAFSRIPWAVEKVEDLNRQLISNRSVSTTRPWIGEYDKEKMEFRLIEPRGFFEPSFLQVVVRGRIAFRNDRTTINIKLRLGLQAFLVFLMIYLLTAVMMVEAISSVMSSVDKANIAGYALWILVFPVLGTFLLNRKLNAVEKKIENLFDLR